MSDSNTYFLLPNRLFHITLTFFFDSYLRSRDIHIAFTFLFFLSFHAVLFTGLVYVFGRSFHPWFMWLHGHHGRADLYSFLCGSGILAVRSDSHWTNHWQVIYKPVYFVFYGCLDYVVLFSLMMQRELWMGHFVVWKPFFYIERLVWLDFEY